MTANESRTVTAHGIFNNNVKDWTFDVYVTVFDKTNYKSNEKDNTEKESYNQIVEKYKKLLGVSEVNWS